MTNQKQIKFYPYTITGNQADQAATELDKEIRNLDYQYEGVAPNSDGYYEAKSKIITKIKERFNVEIK